MCFEKYLPCYLCNASIVSCNALLPGPLIANDSVSQVLRNAGSKVQLLIARDLTNDNHLASPALSQDSLDGKVGVSNTAAKLAF